MATLPGKLRDRIVKSGPLTIEQYMSEALNNLNDVQPVYKTFPGWKMSIDDVKTFSHLPENAKNYINFLKNELEVPIEIISVGPKRNQIIINK